MTASAEWLTTREVGDLLHVGDNHVGRLAKRRHWRVERRGKSKTYLAADVAASVAEPTQALTETLAVTVANYRLALELARGAIHLGRYDEALAAIDAVTP